MDHVNLELHSVNYALGLFLSDLNFGRHGNGHAPFHNEFS